MKHSVGIVTTWFEKGAGYVSKQFYKVLRNEFDVYIYARGGERFAKGDPDWDFPGVTWAEKRFGESMTGIDADHFYKWVNKNRIELVIFNEQNDFGILYECKKWGLPIVAYIDYYKKNDIEKFKIYDGLICNTKRHYSVFKGFPNAVYIPWGTDVEYFKQRQSPIREKYKKVTFFHNAGFLGKNKRKGTRELLEAFKKIRDRKKRLIIHSQVSLIGLGLKQYLYVVFSPRIKIIRKNVYGLFHLGDIYVYPTKHEGIGLTICEALASGTPVITTNSAPMNEFVIDGYNGKLVNVVKYVPRSDNHYWDEAIISVEDLKNKMEYFLDNRDDINTYKLNARKYAEEERNWNKNGMLLVEYIKSFLG